MDSQTRSKYASLLREDWIKLGYPVEDDLGLTGDFHPLFQRTNDSRPPGAKHIWPQFKSESEYETLCAELGTSLQMASNMLQTPKSLGFLYQVAYSPRRVSKQGLSNQGRPCKEFGWSEPADNAHQIARAALRHLAHSLTFQIRDPEAHPRVQGSVAVTAHTLLGFTEGVKINDASSIRGMASIITINQDIIDKLRELDAQDQDTTSQKMSLQMKIAKTLCHEIAHALAFAVDRERLQLVTSESNASIQAEREGRPYRPQGANTDEPFYRDDTRAEIGDCWENQVFGGKITWSGNPNDPLFVSKWPSFLTSDNYPPTRGREKRTGRKYVVSLHFIRNMHRQGFWDNVDPNDTDPLHIKKTIGIEYQNPDAEALSINSSEFNWPHDENSGRVSRQEDGQPPSRANETQEERYARETASRSGA